MLNTLRDRAVRVVLGAAPDTSKIQLIKELRRLDHAAGGLADYKAAIEWAQANATVDAAELPRYSIVATRDQALIKAGLVTDLFGPWSTSSIGGWRLHDHEVTELLQSGQATILRVGTGA